MRLILRLSLAFLAHGAFGIRLQGRRQVLRNFAEVSSLVAASSSLVSASSAAADPTTTLLTQQQAALSTTDSQLLILRNGLAIPRVGYSLYKTAPDQVASGVSLALQAGVRHFDVASQYGTNDIVGKVLNDYVKKRTPLEENQSTTKATALTRRERQNALFVTHKISNSEQSTNVKQVMRAMEQQRSLLKLDSIHVGMIHSPLTDKSRRLATYQALLELQSKGKVQSIGVANYGLGPLQEICDAGLPPPDVIQLILSPFQQHRDIINWARRHGSAVSCSAWSKLSSAQGPQDGWAVLAKIAARHNVTKAQVLVKWAVQSDYLCVPRSSSKYKIDQRAIYENSWQGTQHFVLTNEEMAVLNGLDEQLPAGRLGIVDGWDALDIVNDQWDPTLVV